MSVSLAALFARALESASKASALPTVDDATQDLIRSSLTDLNVLAGRVSALALFSPNESVDDIGTRDLSYLLVPYVLSEVRGRVRTPETDGRILSLSRCQNDVRQFLSTLENYDIVPRTERSLYETNTLSITNAAERRELKIRQYKKERELRTRIQEVRKRRRQQDIVDDNTINFDLVLSLLPSPEQTSDDNEDEDGDDDENLREATLLLLRLMYAQSRSQLESMDQEMQLLRNMPRPPPLEEPTDDRGQRKSESDQMWKLDAPSTSMQGGQQPLFDAQGRPLRPITFVSSRDADRARLQAQVFGPGHRLPTMSIEEYLEIERQRGNIIPGGGKQSEMEPTSSEQLTQDAEMDGTVFGEEKAEEKRLKDENWARFTDENPRGQGNTMNRG